MDDSHYAVLGKGEAYREDTKVGRSFGDKKPLRSFEQAAELLLPQVLQTEQDANALPAKAQLDEIVVEVRMDQGFVAKSYLPSELFQVARLTIRGTGKWLQRAKPRASKNVNVPPAIASPLVESRAFFVSGPVESVVRLRSAFEGRIGGDGAREEATRIEEIRLPGRADRVRGTFAPIGSDVAVELVLYQWDLDQRTEALRRLELFAHSPRDFRSHKYVDGPTFVAALVPSTAIDELGGLNYLRTARQLPRVDLTRTAVGVSVVAPAVPKGGTPRAWMAVFDGGVVADHPHLKGYVIAKDETSAPVSATMIEHGTAVCSAALYGPIKPNHPVAPPTIGIRAYRVLPDPRDVFELYGVIDALERVVPSLPEEVKVVNLSLGPAGPIDDAPSRFTYAIDRLAYETERLFFVAVGNWGDKSGFDRIQAPSDAVNAVGIGAWEVDPLTATVAPAFYSCVGPGRGGCAVKPDWLMNGGSASAPLYVLDSTPGTLVGTLGTSFAAPQAAATAATLLAEVSPKLSPQGTRALMMASCNPMPGHHSRAGWGRLDPDPASIVSSIRNKVSVLYQAELTPRNSWKLPFLVPTGLSLGGNVRFGWTVTFAPDIDGSSYDEYTLGGLEIQFRAHSRIHWYTNPKKQSQFEKLHEVDDAKQIAKRLAEGWRKALQPVADSRRMKSEAKLRALDAKWDTVLRGSTHKRAANIEEPFLTISMVGRGVWDRADANIRAKFAAVLAVEAPHYSGDLFERVTSTFTKLEPLKLQVVNIVQVKADN